MFHSPRSQIWRVVLLAIPLLMGPNGAFAANVLFEDDFNSGTWKPEWESRMCCQEIREGWLHSMDTDGWPLDAMAVVHDGDQHWRDYTLSLKAQFAETTEPGALQYPPTHQGLCAFLRVEEWYSLSGRVQR